jgi:hypothetical protein
MANRSQAGGAYGSGLPQGNYAQLMQSLMTNPQAFTGGGFGQTLAANPMQGGMSPQAMALSAGWQPNVPGQQIAPSPSFAWGQQYGGAGPQQQWPSSSPIGAALAGWQPPAPAQQQAGDPIGAFIAQQQAAQAAVAQQAAQQAAAAPQQPAQPVDNGTGGSGGE